MKKNNLFAFPESWRSYLGHELAKPYYQSLEHFVVDETQHFRVYPPNEMIFNAFKHTAFEDVKVVLLGQDPYHGPKQAHGLCFSVQKGVKTPPSLVNIYKEIQSDLGFPVPNHGDLTSWADNGVLLLNTTLTVRESMPKSHAGKGWEEFTDAVIKTLSDKKENLVFLLWGSHAQSKEVLIDSDKHLILKSAHPSPLSAYRGFLGCKHFSQCNAYLEQHSIDSINWEIPSDSRNEALVLDL